VSAGGQAANARGDSSGPIVDALYDPLEPLELEPWSGGAGVGVDAAGLELGGAATGDAGFGAMWLAGWLAGAAGAAGRGAIGDAPTCVGAGEAGPEAGGVVETGRGGAGGGANGLGAGGGTKGFGAGAGDAATGFGGSGGATGRGAAGAGVAAIGFGGAAGFGGSAAGFGAGIAAAGCLGAVF
jgi:hypothetical protein